jgi:hypothetical protein
MSDEQNQDTKTYEIRLLKSNGKIRLFAATVATDGEAADFAKGLLLRHNDCEAAEIWHGIRLVRQL